MNRTNLSLAGASLVLSVAAVVVGAKICARVLDIRDPAFRPENQLGMWEPDPAIGFVNTPNFSTFAWGNVPVRTNERGFRGSGPTSLAKTDGVVRIVAMGDSVMWGTGVREERAIPGILAHSLNAGGSYEVVNAAVVGYSTYQELLQLERHVLPLQPDVVLVNYCDNDTLPTEDPFGNARRMHVEYLSRLLEQHAETLTDEEASGIRHLIAAFGSGGHVWSAFETLQRSSPKLVALVRKVFVEIPVARMADVSRGAGVRLIYVFIPPPSDRAAYGRTVEALKVLLGEHGAEFVDVQAALTPDADELARPRGGRRGLAWVWPPELRQVLTLWRRRGVQRRRLFLDPWHPTERGNAIVAAHIHRHLTETSPTHAAPSRSWLSRALVPARLGTGGVNAKR